MNRCMHARVLVALVAVLVVPLAGGAESLSGELRWAAPRALSFAVSGVVQDVVARPGMVVAEGEVLARLDPRAFAQRAAHAQSMLDATLPVLEEARREAETAADLHERTVLSDYELRDAQLALQHAEAEHRRRQAEFALAELDAERSVLRAPVDSLVLEVGVQPGVLVVSTLEAGAHVTVAMARAMDVYVPVARDTFARTRLGAGAQVTVSGQRYAAEVVELVLPTAERPGAGLVLRFAHPAARRYYPGTAVTVRLP